MQRLKILILLVVFAGCKDNDINTNDGTFSYDFIIDGKSYTWSGGIPATGMDGQCSYTVNGNIASIILAEGKGINPNFSLAGNIPTGIGSFTIDKNSMNSNWFIGGFLSQTETLAVSGDNILKVTVDKIDSDKHGNVTGSINGKMTIVNTSTSNMREASVVGTFKACKMN